MKPEMLTNKKHVLAMSDKGFLVGLLSFALVLGSALTVDAQSTPSVVAGGDTTAVVRSDGTLWAWGFGYWGSNSSGAILNQVVPVQISGLSNVQSVALGYYQQLAVEGDGSLWLWNTFDWGTNSVVPPSQITGFGTGALVVAASSGQTHSVALLANGTVWAWGSNYSGQLGNGTTVDSSTPVPVTGLTNVVAIAAGSLDCTLALMSDGTLWAWGDNSLGQLGDGTNTNRNVPVQVGTWTDVTAIAAGRGHAMALRSDGSVWAWGYNYSGQLGDGTTTDSNVPLQVSGISGALGIGCGDSSSYVINGDHSVSAWGDNESSELGDGTNVQRTSPVAVTGAAGVVSITAGDAHAVALLDNGDLAVWGTSTQGQLGDGSSQRYETTTTTLVSTPSPVKNITGVMDLSVTGVAMAAKNDGTVWAWGGFSETAVPVQVTGFSGSYKKVAGTAALKSDGTVWTWQGAGSTPTQISGLSSVTAIADMGGQLLVVKADGTLWIYGTSGLSQVTGVTNVVAARSYSGGTGSTFLKSDGTAWRLAGPVQMGNRKDIAAISGSTVMVMKDGTVWNWVSNQYQQYTALSDIVDVDSSGSYFLKVDGTVCDSSGTAVTTLHGVAKIIGGGAAFLMEDGTIQSWGGSPGGTNGENVTTIQPTPETLFGFSTQYAAPSVSITSSGTNVALGQSTTITTSFTAGGGTESAVNFYHKGVLLGTATSAPYSFSFQPWTWGDFEITAVAEDSNGVYSATSAPVTIHAPYDSDSNGLPDWWEMKYFSSLGNSPTADPDMDGLTNLQEYVLGTNPTVANTGSPAAFQLAVVDGAIQYAQSGQFAGIPLVVRATYTLNGAPVATSPVTFTVTSGGGLVATTNTGTPSPSSSVTVNTDADGLARVYYQQASSAMADSVITATDGTVAPVTMHVKWPGARQLAGGTAHTVVVQSTGAVWSWGYNLDGELGIGSSTQVNLPTNISGLSSMSWLASGYLHILAVKSDGTLSSWGSNANGQLGIGSTTLSNTPVSVSGVSNVMQAAAGSQHSLALTWDGNVWAWGGNGSGQVGDGTGTQRTAPVQLLYLAGINGIAAGNLHSLAVANDGTVWAWGSNSNGQLGDGTITGQSSPEHISGLSSIVAVAAGASHSLALTSSGTVYAWGSNSNGQLGDGTTTDRHTPTLVSGLTGVSGIIAIAAGQNHSVALASDGTLWVWGSNSNGQLGDNTLADQHAPEHLSGLSGVIAVAAGQSHTVIETIVGGIWVWGSDSSGQLGDGTETVELSPVPLSPLSNGVRLVAAGSGHSLAMDNSGAVWAWGSNSNGQFGNGSTISSSVPVPVSGLSNVVALCGGAACSFAIDNSGGLWAWGASTSGQLGTGTGDLHTPQKLTSLSNVVAASSSSNCSFAVTSGGSLYAWGQNGFAQLGLGTTASHATPVQVTSLSGVVAVAASADHTLALKSNGTVYAWGLGANGQLGTGTTASHTTPVQVTSLSNIVAISASTAYSMALKNDGTIYTWGSNGGGGNSPVHLTSLSGIVSIAAGQSYTTALKNDGTIYAWGSNSTGQLGDGTTTSHSSPEQITSLVGIVQFSTNGSHGLAVKQDGTLFSWGAAGGGQIGEGTGITFLPTPELVFNLQHSAPSIAVSATPTTTPIGQSVSVTTSFTAADGAEGTVNLYHHGLRVGSSTTSPYSFTFTPFTWGDFALKATVTDSAEAISVPSTPVVVHVPYDSDSNGLPDWWEMKNFGHLGNLTTDDPDGDGLNNLAEYQQGSDPTNYYSQGSVLITPQFEVIHAGDQTTLLGGRYIAALLVVKVKDATTGTALSNAPVTATLSSGDGHLSAAVGTPSLLPTANVRTDGSGLATVYLQQPWGSNLPEVVTFTTGNISTTMTLNIATPSVIFADIGSPSAASSLSGDPTAGSDSVQTTALGIGAASGNDQLAFAYEPLNSTGYVRWTQPMYPTDGTGNPVSGPSGRMEGLMIRSSVTDALSPMVFFGYQYNSSGVPQLVLTWRKAGANAVHDPVVIDPSTLPGSGSPQIQLEWIRHYVVASYYDSDAPTPAWKPLYSFDLDDANSSGQVYGGLAFASGSGAASWEADVADAASWSAKPYPSCWWQVVEPWVTTAWTTSTSPPRVSFMGLQDSSSFETGNIPIDPTSWDLHSGQNWLTNGDYFSYQLNTNPASTTTVSMTENCIVQEPVDVFVRWGKLSTPSQASHHVTFQATRAVLIDGFVVTVPLSKEVDQSVDAETWVYLGTFPASTDPADSSAGYVTLTMSSLEDGSIMNIDGVMLVTRSNLADSDNNGIPDWWQQYYNQQFGALNPGDDYMGDGISNEDHYSVGYPGLDDWVYGSTADTLGNPFHGYTVTPPTITIIGSSERKIPVETWLQDPLQVKVTYPGTDTPVKGYALWVYGQSTPDADFLTYGAAPSGVSFTNVWYPSTDALGVASVYLYCSKEALENDPMQRQVFVSSTQWGSSLFDDPAIFTIDPYVDHPIGPIDVFPVNEHLVATQHLDSSSPYAVYGLVNVSGPWMAVTIPQNGSIAGQIQMYQWDSTSSTWRFAVVINSPITPASADGFGAKVKLSGDFLAVQAPAANSIFIYHLNEDTAEWTKEATISTSGITVDDFAVSPRFFAMGSDSGTSIHLYRRNSTSIGGPYSWITAGSLSVSAEYTSDFHRRLVFADDGSNALFVSGTQASSAVGNVQIFTVSGINTWTANASSPGDPTGSGTQQAFGNGLGFAYGKLVVGGPVQGSVTDPTAKGNVTVYTPVMMSGVPDWSQAPSLQTSTLGPARDFGNQVWVGQSDMLTAFNSVPPSGGQTFDTLMLYHLDDTTGLSLRQTLSIAGTSAVMEGDSFFAAGMLSLDGVTQYQLVAQIPSPASLETYPPYPLVANFHVTDTDGDLTSVTLTPVDQILQITSPNSITLRSGVDLSPFTDTVQLFQMQATDVAGNFYQENYLLQITGPVPDAPTSLTATQTGNTSAVLTWSDSQNTVTQFHIERAFLTANLVPDGSESYSEIALVNGLSHSFNDVVNPSTCYAYRIRAESPDGLSGYSNLAATYWDLDSDGIADWWERLYAPVDWIHTDPGWASEASYVGSPMTNLQKYLAGENPKLADTDGDGQPDLTDPNPLDANKNSAGLLIFTSLR